MEINIKLEKLNEKDFPFYFQLVNDIKVMKMITERAIEEEEAKVAFEKIIQNNKLSSGLGHFKILDWKSNAFLGILKLEIKADNNSEAEIGYMILPTYWGKGIAGKGVRKIIESAKNYPELKGLFAIIDPENMPSRKILTNNGFVFRERKDFNGLSGEILELTL